jgi:hypothetical protein
MAHIYSLSGNLTCRFLQRTGVHALQEPTICSRRAERPTILTQDPCTRPITTHQRSSQPGFSTVLARPALEGLFLANRRSLVLYLALRRAQTIPADYFALLVSAQLAVAGQSRQKFCLVTRCSAAAADGAAKPPTLLQMI